VSGPVPQSWLPDAPVARLLCHWTGGASRASLFDRARYHLLIQGDGATVRGWWSIGRWPPQTRRLNHGSVGIALCGTAESGGRPLDPGAGAISPFQMSRLVAVLAQLVDRYDLVVSLRTVLSHAEVPGIYGLPQREPADITCWPGRPELIGASDVGDELRNRVEARLGTSRQAPRPQPIGRLLETETKPFWLRDGEKPG
jgi:N-acetylmuramoyl-L-alanine amidase